jgi:hypothetical protein
VCYLIENKGDKHMTSNEFEAWLEQVTHCSPSRMLYRFDGWRLCRICGEKLQDGEVDVCDGCFDSEQLRM